MGRALITAGFETRQPFAYDHRVVRPDGEIRWLSCEGLVEVDGSGDVVRLRGTAQDITGRREAQDQLRRLLDELADQAVHDALTGLPNRGLVAERLGQAPAPSGRAGAPGAGP